MKIQNQLNRILAYFHRPEVSAKSAKERLQIIIAHERGERDKPDYLQALQKDILAVIAKYVDIRTDDVKIELERQQGCSVLELNVVLPTLAQETDK
jgi:cell division topological specificity factor